MKKLRMLGIVILVAFLMLILFVSSCISFKTKRKDADSFFAGRPHQPRYFRYRNGTRNIHYVEVGEEEKTPVVFVHGSPGSWGAFMGYLGNERLLARAKLISVDRPGFGESDYGVPEKSIAKQAADLKPLLESQHRPSILVGHSLGGPVIARIAMDYPELVASLVLIAPSIDPNLEKVTWYQTAADWELVSWMVPTDLLTANREILPLKADLQEMLPLWSKITVPVTIIHGEKDRLVPVANVDFAQKRLVHAPLTVVREPELNHFIPWKRGDLVRDAILIHLDFAGSAEQAPSSSGSRPH